MSWVSLTSDGGSTGSSNEKDYKHVAIEAFASPTNMSSSRLGKRTSKDGPASISSSTGSGSSSRRSPSLVKNEDDAESFKEIIDSTQVVIPKSQASLSMRERTAKARQHLQSKSGHSRQSNSKQSTTSGEASSSSGTSNIKPPGKNENVISHHSGASKQSCSSMTSSYHTKESIKPPTASNRKLNSGAAAEMSHSSGTSVSVSLTSEGYSTLSGSRKDLDLAHNDNSFHVIGGLIVEFFQTKQQPDSPNHVTLTTSDLAQLDRLAPPRVRSNFVEAVRHRNATAKNGSKSSVDVLARRCHDLGFDLEGPQNPLLMATDTDGKVMIPVPVSFDPIFI